MPLIEIPPELSTPTPEPTQAIAFDQAIRDRLVELGMDEAELTYKYAGLLAVKAARRRSMLSEILKGNSDPRLKTVFSLLHPQVLDGELLIQWGNSSEFVAIAEREDLAQVIRQRMVELELNPEDSSDVYTLTRQYCILRASQENPNPANYVKVIKQMIGKDPNSRLGTVAVVAQALQGKLLLRWKQTIRQEVQSQKSVATFLQGITSENNVIIEYQNMGLAREIKAPMSQSNDLGIN